MPIELLAIITPLGIALIVLVVRYSGLSKKAGFKDEQHAITIFRSDYPAEATTGVAVLDNQRIAALVELTDQRRLGLAETFGDRFITRLLSSSDIANISESAEYTLEVTFNDFTHPSATYVFADSDAFDLARRWLKRMEQ